MKLFCKIKEERVHLIDKLKIFDIGGYAVEEIED